MALDQDLIEEQGITASEHKRTTFGTGLLKGLGITLRHLLHPAVTMQYPDEKDDYPARSRGVIALKIENCTVCMLCARECPDWCIYIEGHKEAREPVAEGKRAKKFNILDRFAIDYALCMYCGICVEVCPYDALFWSPEYEYADSDVVELTHEMDTLAEWMTGVLPPMALDEGAQGPELKAALPPSSGGLAGSAPDVSSSGASEPPRTPPVAPSAPAAVSTGPPTPKLDPDLVYRAVLKGELAAGNEQKVAEARARTAANRIKEEAIIFSTQAATPVPPAAQGSPAPAPAGPEAPTAPAPTEAEAPAAAVPAGAGVSAQEAAAVRKQVHEQELAKGSDPRVAEGRAKAAEMRALKGTKGPS